MSMSCDDGEPVDVYRVKQVIARKTHQCDACLEPTIIPGKLYTSIGVVWEGTAETIKRCPRCQTIYEHLRKLCPRGEVPDDRLNCGHEYQERWEVEPPEDIAALAFWLPGDMLP